MLNVPFLFCVSTSWPMQSKQITRRQNKRRKNNTGGNENKEKTQKTENVINSDLTLGLKGDFGKQNKGTDKRRVVENGFGQWETLNQLLFHMFHSHTHTCIQSCTHSRQRQRQRSHFLSLSLSLTGCDGEKRERKKRERERARDQLLVGVDRASSAPHRRITLERTHHLCSFVELSHFNPWAHLGTDSARPSLSYFLSPTHSRAPPPPLKPPAPAPVSNFHLCAVACGVRYTALVYFHRRPKPPTTGLPHVYQEQQVKRKGSRLCDIMLVCVPYIFTDI